MIKTRKSKRSINNRRFLLILLSGIGCFILLSYSMIRKTEEEGMVYVNGHVLVTEDPITHAQKKISVKPFLMDKNLVTVAEFQEFVTITGYVTEAEKFGNSGVFLDETHQWEMIEGANYLYPFGREKGQAKADHPVTQISWNDAWAYAKWKGKRLPTQWEWELAAKNGTNNNYRYAWGNHLVEDGKYKANTWQGSFPNYNTKADGYLHTSPVGAFGENGLGLTDMGGNVWQWCQDDIAPTPQEAAIDQALRKVLRGGSFLCEPNVCHGYQVSGRASSTPESSMVHIGFRCAKDG